MQSSRSVLFLYCTAIVCMHIGPVEDLLQRAYSIYCTLHGAHHERSISCRVSRLIQVYSSSHSSLIPSSP